MAASFPSSLRTFTARTDLVDTVIADNVNSLYEEVRAIEQTLGYGLSSPLTNGFTSGVTFTQTPPVEGWSTLTDRLNNIEIGVKNQTVVTTQGDLVIGGGSGLPSRLAIGANGTYLSSNGTTASWSSFPSYISPTNGTVSTAAITGGVVRNIFTKTTIPTGSDGAVGDIWIVYV
jgi:hypothetical protein